MHEWEDCMQSTKSLTQAAHGLSNGLSNILNVEWAAGLVCHYSWEKEQGLAS